MAGLFLIGYFVSVVAFSALAVGSLRFSNRAIDAFAFERHREMRAEAAARDAFAHYNDARP